MRFAIQLISFITAGAAFAGEHPAGGTLKITKYSHSILKDGTVCEGTMADRKLKGGGDFDSIAVEDGKLPKTVALHAKHGAVGCTLVFKTGPWAGQSVPVGDGNGHDTIDVAIDTSSKKNRKECKEVIDAGKPIPVEYSLTNCEGHRGTSSAVPRAAGTEKPL